jgi:hypothetical protein
LVRWWSEVRLISAWMCIRGWHTHIGCIHAEALLIRIPNGTKVNLVQMSCLLRLLILGTVSLSSDGNSFHNMRAYTAVLLLPAEGRFRSSRESCLPCLSQTPSSRLYVFPRRRRSVPRAHPFGFAFIIYGRYLTSLCIRFAPVAMGSTSTWFLYNGSKFQFVPSESGISRNARRANGDIQ